MTEPAHISHIRPEVRLVLQRLQDDFAREDERLERDLIAAAREARLAAQVPALCKAVMELNGMSLRSTFRAVALQTGFTTSYVRNLYYGSAR